MKAFLHRLEQNLGGGPITGFTFLQDAREMLVFSRKIESATLLSQARALLYVGFQTAAKLDGEWERYSHLLEHGAITHGFGTDVPVTQVADDWMTSLAGSERKLNHPPSLRLLWHL